MKVFSDYDFLSSQETAARLDVHVGTLARWRASGYGPRWFQVSSRRVKYLASDVDAWLAAQARGGE